MVLFFVKHVEGQILFVVGDFENDIRIHHIHVIKWNEADWNNYINFQDYLNAYPQKTMMYDNLKRKLAMQFSDDRNKYTVGKKVNKLINERSKHLEK